MRKNTNESRKRDCKEISNSIEDHNIYKKNKTMNGICEDFDQLMLDILENGKRITKIEAKIIIKFLCRINGSVHDRKIFGHSKKDISNILLNHPFSASFVDGQENVKINDFRMLINHKGRTPLQEACFHKQSIPILKFLCKMGCDIYIRDQVGNENALEIAMNNQFYTQEVLFLYTRFDEKDQKNEKEFLDKNESEILPFIVGKYQKDDQYFHNSQCFKLILFLIQSGDNPFKKIFLEQDDSIKEKMFPFTFPSNKNSKTKDLDPVFGFTCIRSIYEKGFNWESSEHLLLDSIIKNFGFQILDQDILLLFLKGGLFSFDIMYHLINRGIIEKFYFNSRQNAFDLFASMIENKRTFLFNANPALDLKTSIEIYGCTKLYNLIISPLLNLYKDPLDFSNAQKDWVKTVSECAFKEACRPIISIRKITYLVECGASLETFNQDDQEINFMQALCYNTSCTRLMIDNLMKDIKYINNHLYLTIIKEMNPLIQLFQSTTLDFWSIKGSIVGNMIRSVLNPMRQRRMNFPYLREEGEEGGGLADDVELFRPVIFDFLSYYRESYISNDLNNENSIPLIRILFYQDFFFPSITTKNKQNLLHVLLEPLFLVKDDDSSDRNNDDFISTKLIDFMLKLKIPLNKEDSYGRTPLDYALINKYVHQKSFEKMVKLGAKLSESILLSFSSPSSKDTKNGHNILDEYSLKKFNSYI